MIRVKLMSILVNDQNRARRFYTDVLGFEIKHDIPLGEAAWLTLVATRVRIRTRVLPRDHIGELDEAQFGTA